MTAVKARVKRCTTYYKNTVSQSRAPKITRVHDGVKDFVESERRIFNQIIADVTDAINKDE